MSIDERKSKITVLPPRTGENYSSTETLVKYSDFYRDNMLVLVDYYDESDKHLYPHQEETIIYSLIAKAIYWEENIDIWKKEIAENPN